MTAITGWQRVRPARYRHDNGTTVCKAATDTAGWQVTQPGGAFVSGFESMQDAMRYAQKPALRAEAPTTKAAPSLNLTGVAQWKI